MAVLKRLFTEFWLPALLAVAWTFYNATTASHPWDLKTAINIFGPSFFLLSWATAQYFRVRKQVRVDQNLQSIEKRVELLIEILDERTSDLVAHITGGNSFCHVVPVRADKENPNLMRFIAVHGGTHAIFGVRGRMADLDCFAKTPQDLKICESHFAFDELRVGSAHFLKTPAVDTTNGFRANIFFDTRGGQFVQFLRLVKTDKGLTGAILVHNQVSILLEDVPPDFPLDLTKDSDWNGIKEALKKKSEHEKNAARALAATKNTA